MNKMISKHEIRIHKTTDIRHKPGLSYGLKMLCVFSRFHFFSSEKPAQVQ